MNGTMNPNFGIYSAQKLEQSVLMRQGVSPQVKQKGFDSLIRWSGDCFPAERSMVVRFHNGMPHSHLNNNCPAAYMERGNCIWN